ncbi:hypothetical protein V8G54_025229 [Vigna mungo]|uniref:Uncharacterized protein n=1 Tax=Vigna mungo TaxID=3915 RepID=A0AAQ3N941_VIGMU
MTVGNPSKKCHYRRILDISDRFRPTKEIIARTCGSKSIARENDEMEKQCGHKVSRSEGSSRRILSVFGVFLDSQGLFSFSTDSALGLEFSSQFTSFRCVSSPEEPHYSSNRAFRPVLGVALPSLPQGSFVLGLLFSGITFLSLILFSDLCLCSEFRNLALTSFVARANPEGE